MKIRSATKFDPYTDHSHATNQVLALGDHAKTLVTNTKYATEHPDYKPKNG